MSNSKPNENYMRRAIELAVLGEGLVNPNPMVGCVVVKDGRIIAEGWHERCGGFHAERNALLSCTEDVRGAELYVTLEPCCHTGKTPPCTDIIIERGISKVYIGSDDPNPLVAGHGIELLKNAGIEVETHVLKDECDVLNEVFFHYITTKRPYVAMKYAMTLDGKIAMGRQVLDGADRQITGAKAREHVHSLRKRYKAILVGVGTVLADDPMLNYRGEKASETQTDIRTKSEQSFGTSVRDTIVEPRLDPIRIILDSHLRIPLTTKIVQTAREIPTIIATLETGIEDGQNTDQKADSSVDQTQTESSKNQNDTNVESTNEHNEKHEVEHKAEQLEAAGVILWQLPPDASGHVDIEALIKKMGEEGIDSVLVEGGSKVHGSLLAHPELIDRVYAYISPKLIGGEKGLSPVGGEGVAHMSDAIRLEKREIIPLGEDILITGRVIH